jgi:hypothetical protein
MAFILGHETLHILLNHLALNKKFPRKDVFNIAADCVINDYLVNMGLPAPMIDTPEGKKEMIMRGEPNVGYDCSNATVSEVYHELCKKFPPCPTCNGTGETDKQQDQGDQGDGQGQGDDQGDQGDQQGQDSQGDGQGDQDGQGQDAQGGQGSQPGQQHGDQGKQPCPDCQGSGSQAGDGQGGWQPQGASIDDHGWMVDRADDKKAQEAVQKAIQDAGAPQDVDDKRADDDAKTNYHMGPGAGVTGEKQFAEQAGVSLQWAALLREVDPDIFKRGGPPKITSWHSPRRKMGAFMDVTRLPVQRIDNRNDDGDLPAIVMALDTSGSCSMYADTFITLAKSVPQDKLKLFALTFTSVAQELDLDNPSYRSGGTAFSPIEQYIRDNVMPELGGKYPKAVVVVTDGEAYFHDPKPGAKEGERWTWLLTDGGGFSYGDRPGTDKRLDDFVAGGKVSGR